MIAAILAFLASALTGGADFSAGISSRRIGAMTTSFWVYLAATALSFAILLLTPSRWAEPAVAAGLIAAVFGAAAFVAFYASLALAPMGVVAAIVAASEAVLPVAVGVGWMGEDLSAIGWIGVLAAVLGAVIVGAAEGSRGAGALRAVALAVFSGVAFGCTVVALGAAPASSGFVAPTLEMAGGLVLIVLMVAVIRAFAPVRRYAGSLGLLGDGAAGGGIGFGLLAGVMQGIANIVLMLALWSGLLSVVGVIVCLYPITTAVLARVILKERLTRLHLLGIGIALAGCVMLGAA